MQLNLSLSSCGIAMLFIVVGCNNPPPGALVVPDQLILYSIDGRDLRDDQIPKEAELLYRYPVLGKIEVTGPDQRKEIIAALNEGIAKHDGLVAACFWPRHAIRAIRNGESTDYIICFECEQFQINGVRGSTKTITRSPQKLLNRFLTEAGVKLAPGIKEDE